MKVLLILSAVAIFCAVAIPRASCQDDVAGRGVLERLTPQGNFLQYAADKVVVRNHSGAVVSGYTIDVAAVLNASPNASRAMIRAKSLDAIPHSTVHLEGRVEITIFNKALVWPAVTRDELSKETVLTADEADYDVDTGEIHPQGHVSIKMLNSR